MHCLTDAHPGTVHGAEDDMVRKRRSRLQHIENLLRAEDDRQAMIFLEAGNELNGPITFQSDGVEEPERADCDDSGSNRHLPLLGQVDLVVASVSATPP